LRIIKPSRVREYAGKYPQAASSLMAWLKIARGARWESIQDARRTLPTADGVKVISGRTVTIFNICGGRYRLVTAIHYNHQMIYVLRFMTHAEYDKQKWKAEL
jgi:mRNA interferase HigB